MQKIILIGNLGRDIEERYTSSGKKVLSFSIAVSVKKNDTIWYECAIWENRIPLFEGIVPFLKKGSKIHLIGDLAKPEIYKANDGTSKIKNRVDPISINFAGGAPAEDKPSMPLLDNLSPSDIMKQEEKKFNIDEDLPF